jgi:hypothetical protein
MKKKMFKESCQNFLESFQVISESDNKLFTDVYKRLRDITLEEVRNYKQKEISYFYKKT